MIIQRWNPTKKEYEPTHRPDDWKLPLMSYDMDEVINCVNCGCEMAYGDGYTSKRWHTKYGMGYCECPTCYEEYMED